LPKVDKSSGFRFSSRIAAQVSFEAFVESLGMAVRLQVISGTNGNGGHLKLKELYTKGASENWVSIRNDRGWNAVELEDVRHENLRYFRC